MCCLSCSLFDTVLVDAVSQLGGPQWHANIGSSNPYQALDNDQGRNFSGIAGQDQGSRGVSLPHAAPAYMHCL